MSAFVCLLSSFFFLSFSGAVTEYLCRSGWVFFSVWHANKYQIHTIFEKHICMKVKATDVRQTPSQSLTKPKHKRFHICLPFLLCLSILFFLCHSFKKKYQIMLSSLDLPKWWILCVCFFFVYIYYLYVHLIIRQNKPYIWGFIFLGIFVHHTVTEMSMITRINATERNW